MSVFKTGGPSAPVSSDPYKPYNTLLMYCEGTDGGTTFTDSMGLCSLNTVVGCTTVTAQKKYGLTSISIPDASTAKLYLNGSPGVFNTGDFTVECWVRYTTVLSNTVIMSTSTSSGQAGTWFMEWGSTGSRSFGYWEGAAYRTFTATNTAPNTNQWYHLAMTRSGSTMRGFIDGVLQANTFTNSTNYSPSGFSIGGYTDNCTQNLIGHIDEIRITNGIARYTSTFTPAPLANP